MTINFEALELAVDLFVLDMQNEAEPDFNTCLRRAIIAQAERDNPAKELTPDQRELADLMT